MDSEFHRRVAQAPVSREPNAATPGEVRPALAGGPLGQGGIGAEALPRDVEHGDERLQFCRRTSSARRSSLSMCRRSNSTKGADS